MDKQLAFVADVTPSNVDVVLRLRIIRLWKTPSYMNPLKPNTIEMVLIDEKDDKIQTYVKKDHVDQFLSILEEGLTITLSDFMVGENAGTFLFAPSKWRLNFQPETTMKMIDNFIGSFKRIHEVTREKWYPLYAVDFCSIFGLFSPQRELSQFYEYKGKACEWNEELRFTNK